jgi:hypothetical protein
METSKMDAVKIIIKRFIFILPDYRMGFTGSVGRVNVDCWEITSVGLKEKGSGSTGG